MSERVLRLPKNTKGRDFAVGDIHGMLSLLEKGLELVQFDPEKDRIICVGDLLNRGPESREAVEFFKRPYAHAVRGNNEDIALDILGSNDVFTQYKDEANRKAVHSQSDRAWMSDLSKNERCVMRADLEALPIAIELQGENGLIGFVHANVPQNMSWQEFTTKLDRNDAHLIGFGLWDRSRAKAKDNASVPGVVQVFYGHTIADHVKVKGNNIFLDTGAFYRDPVGAKYFPSEFKDFKGHMTIAQAGLSNEFYARAKPKVSGAVHALTEYGSVSLKETLDLG